MAFTLKIDADVVKSVSTGRSVLYDLSDVIESLTEEYRTTLLIDTSVTDQQVTPPFLTGARVVLITTDYRIMVKLNVNTMSPAIPIEKTFILFGSDQVALNSIFITNTSGYRATVNIFMAAMG